jgi:hypothetical protein
MLQNTLIAGQNVDIRGTGALIKLDPAASDTARFLYILIDTLITGSVNINLEGFRVDTSSKANKAVEVFSYQTASPSLSNVKISDVDTVAFTTNSTVSAGGIYVYGALKSIDVSRCRIGTIQRKTGLANTFDLSGIYVGRSGTLYPETARVSNCHIDGVYDADLDDHTNLDGIKLFGRTDATQTVSGIEAYSVTDCTFRNCMGRSIKSQSHWSVVERIQSNTEAGFLSINSGRKLVEIDFQFGTGMCRDVRIDYANGTGVDNAIVATTRAYGIDGQMVVDGVNVTDRGASAQIVRGFLRYAEVAGAKPARAFVRNFSMPESTVTNLVGYANWLDATTAANSNERLHIENMQAATVTGSAIEYNRLQAGAKATFTSAGMTHKGTSVPTVTQVSGGPDWTHTAVYPNFGFT